MGRACAGVQGAAVDGGAGGADGAGDVAGAGAAVGCCAAGATARWRVDDCRRSCVPGRAAGCDGAAAEAAD